MAINDYQRSKTNERVKSAFGKVLQEYRKGKMTQEELGFETGYHSTYISQLERGIKQPSIVTVFILAKELGIKPEEMIMAVRKKLTTQNKIPLKKKSRQ